MPKPKPAKPERMVRVSERVYVALVELQSARVKKGEARPALGQILEELLFKK